MGFESQKIFTTEGSIKLTKKGIFSIPNIKLVRAITQTRLQSEQFISEDTSEDASDNSGIQYYGILVASLLDMAIQFEDLSHALELTLGFAKRIRNKFPELVTELVQKTLDVYHNAPQPQPVSTRLAFSRLKMYLAQLQLEINETPLDEIRNMVFHCLPIIHELNFIVILIKAKQYMKASLFLQELSPLFESKKLTDITLALPYYELTCLANLGTKMFPASLEALEKGYQIAQQLPRTSVQATRFLTLFEKVIGFFDSNQGNEMAMSITTDLKEFKIPGVIFDKIFLDSSICKDHDGILVEI
ncbi:MAG: hypothetical protein ACXAC7_16090 [Candidatus Hodarchaeales archaeon]|jgi:hypothetical protein